MVEQGWAFYPIESLQIEVFQGGAHVCMGKDITFNQMKYVVATVVSMFGLQRLVEYSAMGNPKLIHILIACMKGGFPFCGSLFFTYKNTFIK